MFFDCSSDWSWFVFADAEEAKVAEAGKTIGGLTDEIAENGKTIAGLTEEVSEAGKSIAGLTEKIAEGAAALTAEQASGKCICSHWTILICRGFSTGEELWTPHVMDFMLNM